MKSSDQRNPTNDKQKKQLIIFASKGSRSSISSPLMMFVRDYSNILRRFKIVATGGTGRSILDTGLFNTEDIEILRSGPEGGVVKLAATIAKKECEAVIFLSDPLDINSNVPENIAISRICRQLNIRLIDTFWSAKKWIENEALQCLESNSNQMYNWKPGGYRLGNSNLDKIYHIDIPVEEQTIALIAHDEKKTDMIKFVSENIGTLKRFDRILTTGTTGYKLKLIFCDNMQFDNIKNEFVSKFSSQKDKERAGKAIRDCKSSRHDYKNSRNVEFVNKIMPFPSGPKGGDILIAEQVLENNCHAVVFFQDPEKSHAHDPDIRLFERTCQFWSDGENKYRVYATCVSDKPSADNWVKSITKGHQNIYSNKSSAHRLREKYDLLDAIVTFGNSDGQQIDSLNKAAIGYIIQKIDNLNLQKKSINIGVSFGPLFNDLRTAYQSLSDNKLLRFKEAKFSNINWLPTIGIMPFKIARSTRFNANFNTVLLKDIFGGNSFSFIEESYINTSDYDSGFKNNDKEILNRLEELDLYISSADILFQTVKKNYSQIAKDVIGDVGGIFIDNTGEKGNVKDHSIVGLKYESLKELAKNDKVIIISFALPQNKTEKVQLLKTVLEKKLASILITTEKTAIELLK